MGNTHPKSLWKALRAVYPCHLPVGRETIAREHITDYSCACVHYDVVRHHKTVNTAVTSICYQGQLKPNITRLEPLTATHTVATYLV